MPRKKPAVAISPALIECVRPDSFPKIGPGVTIPCIQTGPGITHFVRPADVAALRRSYPHAIVAGNSGVAPGMVWSIDADAKLLIRPLSAVLPDLLFH